MNIHLSEEEIHSLEDSYICLNCNHREIFHNIDYEGEPADCKVSKCRCYRFIKEGDYSHWSIDRYTSWYSRPIPKELEEELNKLGIFNKCKAV